MKIYHPHGINDFVVCCGYRGYVIKEYFANYALHAADVTIDLCSGEMDFRRRGVKPWRITLDRHRPGDDDGRAARARARLADETVLVTYGDGVADLRHPGASIAFHRQQGNAGDNDNRAAARPLRS